MVVLYSSSASTLASAKALREQQLCMRHVSPGRAKRRDLLRCKTLKVNAVVRVFYKVSVRQTSQRLGIFARWRSSHRVTLLGSEINFADSLARIVLSGRYVAFVQSEGTETGSSAEPAEYVVRLNAGTGTRVRVPALGVADLALDPAGTLAWIIKGFSRTVNGESRPNGSRTVLELPPGSKTPTVLATGPAIEPKSLAAVPGYLYWSEAGQPRHAKIK